MAKKQTNRKPSRTTAKTPKTVAAERAPKTPQTRDRDPRLPAAGTTMTRVYKGRELKIAVLDDGFRFEGDIYSSLSALASKATGQASVNGFLWAGLTMRPDAPKAAPAAKSATPAKSRAPKVRRAGRDPLAAVAKESAPEPAPTTKPAMD